MGYTICLQLSAVALIILQLLPTARPFALQQVRHRTDSPTSRALISPLTRSLTTPSGNADTGKTLILAASGDATISDSASSKLFQFYTMNNGMCPYAARTWITLLELDLPFETVGVSPMKKEEWFLKINPNNKVPAIQNTLDGTVLYESAICNEYLSEYARQTDAKKKQKGNDTTWNLMPVDAADRAALRLLNDHVDTVLNPAVFTFLMSKKKEEGGDKEEDDIDKTKAFVETLEMALNPLQNSLVSRGGPFLMGSEMTLADIHVLPFFLRLVVALKHYKGYEIPKDKYALLLDWYDHCSKRTSVQAASKTKEQIVEVYDMFVKMDYAFGGLNKN